MWGAALGEDWGAVLGDLDCGTLQCGLWGWEGWGAQLPRGSKGRHGVGRACSRTTLAPQSSQFNQQGLSNVPNCRGLGQGPTECPRQDPEVALQQGAGCPWSPSASLGHPHGGVTAPGPLSMAGILLLPVSRNRGLL